MPFLKLQGFKFIQISNHCSVSWKISPLSFYSSNLVYFGQKLSPLKRNLQTFLVNEWKFIKTLMSCLKPQVSFSLNFVSLFSAIRKITFLYFFSWNFIWFRQKEPIKMQNFRLSTTHVKFHRICILIGSFCWKYIKFQAKKYREVMSHDTEDWCKIYGKTDLLF